MTRRRVAAASLVSCGIVLAALWSARDLPVAASAARQESQSSAADQNGDEGPSGTELRRQMLEIEGAGELTPAAMETIELALKNKETDTRRLAYRTLGRLAPARLSAMLAGGLADPAPVVRAEAANALAQAVLEGGELGLALDLLTAQLERETQPQTRGAIALSLGRLPFQDAESVRRAEGALVATLTDAEVSSAGEKDDARGGRDIPSERLRFATPSTLLGGLRGLESLVRRHGSATPPEPATIQLLRDLSVVWRSAVARGEGGPTAEVAAHLRRLAMAALVAVNGADPITISTAFGDADDQVRRLAAAAAAATEPLDTRLVERAIRDQAAMVKIELLLTLGRRGHPTTCGYAALGFRDPDPVVEVTAFDVAASACAGNVAVVPAIAASANRLPPPALQDVSAQDDAARDDRDASFGVTFRGSRAATWQPSAHALLALAKLQPQRAVAIVGRFAADARPPVRRYAARAAGQLKNVDLLTKLAGDREGLVAEAALDALRETAAHSADDVYLQALSRDEDRVLAAAARALQGAAASDRTTDALLEALDRVTADRRQSSRAARLALLDALPAADPAERASRLAPYVRDFDPAVARGASSLLARWTGTTPPPDPQPPPEGTLPSPSDLDLMSAARLVMKVRDVGQMEIRLLPQDAPITAWTFYRLVRAGAFDGMVIEDLLPNMAARTWGPTRRASQDDAAILPEIGMQPDMRGSIALARGSRNPGDRAFLIALVDVPSQDFSATVFAQAERGIDVIDALLEGDVIEEIRVGSSVR